MPAQNLRKTDKIRAFKSSSDESKRAIRVVNRHPGIVDLHPRKLISKRRLQICFPECSPANRICRSTSWKTNHQNRIAGLISGMQIIRPSLQVCFPGCKPAKANWWLISQNADRQRSIADLHFRMQADKKLLLTCTRNCRSANRNCRFVFSDADHQRWLARLHSGRRV